MRLHHQLIAVSLLSLIIPWLGGEFMKELEFALRKSQQNGLLISTQAIAQYLEINPSLFQYKTLTNTINHASSHPGFLSHTLSNTLNYPPNKTSNITPNITLNNTTLNNTANSSKSFVNSLYAAACRAKIAIDGYSDDWMELGYQSIEYHNPKSHAANNEKSQLLVCHNDNYLMVMLQIHDQEFIQQPSRSSRKPYDFVRLLLVDEQQIASQYELRTTSPGRFHPQKIDQSKEARIKAAWQTSDFGYNIELKIPLKLTREGFGFITFDADKTDSTKYGSLIITEACCETIAKPPPSLILHQKELDQYLRTFSVQGTRLLLVDRDGNIHSDTNIRQPYKDTKSSDKTVPSDAQSAIAHPYLVQFYRWLLSEASDASHSNLLRFDAHYLIGGSLVSKLLSGDAINTWIPRIALADTHLAPSYTQMDQAHVIAAYPIFYKDAVAGGVIAIQPRAAVLSLTNSATLRVLTLSIACTAFIIFIIILFALLLSYRIKKLGSAVDSALQASNDPSKHKQIPPIKTNNFDEIGALAHSFNQLIALINLKTDHASQLKIDVPPNNSKPTQKKT